MSNADDDFSKKMTAILNYSALNLAMAVGYRLGLFDAGFDQIQVLEIPDDPFNFHYLCTK